MFYLVKTPRILHAAFPQALWRMPAREKKVYLTFDDGPHPAITPFVLEALSAVSAQATFFCIGNNVLRYPKVFEQIIAAGHTVGNHTLHHVNGWKVGTAAYLEDIQRASELIPSTLFRPPYGRITLAQLSGLRVAFPRMQCVMWDVLSADFDVRVSAEQCVRNVIRGAEPGSLVVFHDSEKAFPRLKGSLVAVLNKLQENGYELCSLKNDQAGYGEKQAQHTGYK